MKSNEPFTFGYVPPKEGRVPPAVRLQRRRRATFISILGVIVIICLVLKYVQTSSLTAARARIGAEISKEWRGTAKEQVALKKADQVVKATSPTISTTLSQTPAVATPAKEPESVKVSKEPTKASKELPKDEQFEDALMSLIDMLPSEMHKAALLAPITNSGAQRIHDLGLRTREFKRLFEAWESLHLVYHGDSVYVQDDVISYIRTHKDSFRGRTEEPFDLAQVVRGYESLRWVLQSMGDVLFPWIKPYFGDHMQLHTQLYGGGRGIVFSAGTQQAPFVMTSITVLRNLGCNLPIEVMYLGDGDLDVDSRERLEEIPGVITRDIRQMVKDEGWALAGWAGKPFAILLSSFREVMFIDADAVFLQNPEVLFSDKGYLDTGALFFHDRLMKADGKRRWLESVLPKPISRKARKSRMWGTSDHMQESGVVVVDTWKHFIPLLVVSRMNGPDRDGNSAKGVTGVYDMLFGDKETFWIGWEISGSTQYSFHTGPAGIIGNLPENQRNVSHSETPSSTGEWQRVGHTYSENVTMCAPQLLHIGRDGLPLWFNGWILANKFDKERSPIAELEMYMREPDVYMEPESWTIGESNSCCLRTTETWQFTPKERETIDMILKTAVDVGAVGKTGGTPTRSGKDLYG